MSTFDYHHNSDERFIAWSDVAEAILQPADTQEEAIAIIEANDLALGLYIVPKSALTDVLRSALQQLDNKTFRYRDCLHDPDMAAPALRVLNAMGVIDAQRLLTQITEHFVKDITRAFARAPARDREQVPDIIKGMKETLPSAEDLTKMNGVAHYLGRIDHGDEEWKIEKPELCESRVTGFFVFERADRW